MSKIVDRDTFLYYLDNADVDWEATARECIDKAFELAEENKRLKEKLNDIEYIISYCAINKKSCYFCKFDKECEGEIKDLILKIIRGAER